MLNNLISAEEIIKNINITETKNLIDPEWDFCNIQPIDENWFEIGFQSHKEIIIDIF